MAITEGCPAFQSGCPFSSADVVHLPTLMGSVSGTIAEKCPAFKDGCPFKENDSVETLYNKISEMPSSHQVNKNTPAGKAVGEAMRLVHTSSLTLKSKFDSTCTVFMTSCPFKTVTTYGVPLVDEMDLVIEQWGLQGTVPPASGSSSKVGASESLSKSLKIGTKSVHRAAENVHFVRDFLKGSVPKASFVELLRALYHVYDALEVALDGLPEHLKPCGLSELRRANALASDLRYHLDILEGQTLDVGIPSPAAKQYVDRIQNLSKDDPVLLLAHAYTRYLGDLSGGQILSRSAEKAYNLSDGKGIAFFNFERIGTAPAALKSIKNAYRSQLDSLELPAPQVDAIVHEANLAFLLNILIFEERDVAAGHLQRIRTVDEVSQLIESNKSPLQFQKAYGINAASSNQCPFVPGPAGRRDPGEPSFHEPSDDVCPWPFVWLHDRKSAIVCHPVKNIVGVVAMFGLIRTAARFPRRAIISTICAGILASWLKPKKNDGAKH